MSGRYLLILPGVFALAAQAQVRINEVRPATGGAPWVELHNAGPVAVDLRGWGLSSGSGLARLDSAWTVPATGVLLLDGDRFPALLDLGLRGSGGSLVLVDADRTTMRDVFTWKGVDPAHSIGRVKDGGKEWGYFVEPSPGRTNERSAASAPAPPAPEPRWEDGLYRLSAPAPVHYTLDGRPPTWEDPVLTAPVGPAADQVLRARVFREGALPGKECVLVPRKEGAMALVMDPDDLWDPVRGIHVAGVADNHTRKGVAWRRTAWWHGPQDGTAPAHAVSVAIAGSGSRGLPKKNFKLHASSAALAWNEGPGWGEVILRADATPDAFLRNLFMEDLVARSGRRVDVQGGTPVPLHVNGAYWGLYRVMPPKDEEWCSYLAGGRPVQVVAGPPEKGEVTSYDRMLERLLGGASARELEALIDLDNLIDLAAFDLWMGRADHDINVRCWRPTDPGGRWRWILYDMDLWAPAQEATVPRMLGGDGPEAPFLPQLLARRDLSDRLLARVAALQATLLAPDQALSRADSIHQAHRRAMEADHGRWSRKMPMTSPTQSLAALRRHIQDRGMPLLDQLAKATRREVRSWTMEVRPAHGGKVRLDDLPLTDDKATVRGFAGLPMRLTAEPAGGMEFVGWEGLSENAPTVLVDPALVKQVRAVFRPVGLSREGGLKQGGE